MLTHLVIFINLLTGSTYRFIFNISVFIIVFHTFPDHLQLLFASTARGHRWRLHNQRKDRESQSRNNAGQYLERSCWRRQLSVDCRRAEPHSARFELTEDRYWCTASSSDCMYHLKKIERFCKLLFAIIFRVVQSTWASCKTSPARYAASISLGLFYSWIAMTTTTCVAKGHSHCCANCPYCWKRRNLVTLMASSQIHAIGPNSLAVSTESKIDLSKYSQSLLMK